MEKRFREGEEEIVQYLEEVFSPEDAILRDLREASIKMGIPGIQVGKMDALHLTVIAAASKAKTAVEFGTLAGYSGIALLRGMGEGAFLHTIESQPEHAKFARESFHKAGFSHAVKVWEGAALDKLSLISKEGPFDLFFIDADKENYTNYFNWAVEHSKKGSVLLADNCFAFGNIAAKDYKDSSSKKVVESIREFNSAVVANSNFKTSMLPTGEGLLMAVRIS